MEASRFLQNFNSKKISKDKQNITFFFRKSGLISHFFQPKYMQSLFNAMFRDCVISEPCYKGTVLQKDLIGK